MTLPGALLLFEIDGHRFGAEARDVFLIGAGAADLEAERVTNTVLGTARDGARSLVVPCPDGRRELVIDRVLGLRTPDDSDWFPLPEVAAVCLRTRAVRGLLLEGRILTPVVDLPALLSEPAVVAPMETR